MLRSIQRFSVRPRALVIAFAVLFTILPTFVSAQTAPAGGAQSRQASGGTQAAGGEKLNDILNLDIDQLAKVPVSVPSMDIPVTSVTKEESTVGRSAAAVFVITNEMIRRSGATCVPDALRMAPGLDVAQVSSNTWAISCRGFNSTLANKLLVLIDGRSVYSPVFSGVFWDAQDVLLEDVERIEVIRGPGGTLWGSNAVDGVINIITKRAADTQGAYVGAISGNVIRSQEAARYGGELGDGWKYRVYGKYFDRGEFYNPSEPPHDGWNQGRVGFRADWNLAPNEPDSFTIEGEHFVGNSGGMGTFAFPEPPYSETVYGNIYNTGQHLLARYRHVIDEDSDWEVQTYYDNFQRDELVEYERVKTADVDLQYRFLMTENQQITCGAGYRHIHDNLPSNSPYNRCIPTDRSYYVANQFIQDEITLRPETLKMIVGCKLEQNSFTGLEYQPTIRGLYTPDRTHTLWGAISRAVHIPSRKDVDKFIVTFDGDPPFDPTIADARIGNPDEKSETLFAYELGYRTQATDKFSWDLALFYNDYDQLRSYGRLRVIPGPPYKTYERQMNNAGCGYSYGSELAVNYAVSDSWKIFAQYTYLQMHLFNTTLYGSRSSPQNQIYLHSSWNLRENLDFDLIPRYYDYTAKTSTDVPAYIEMDIRLAWRPKKHLELAVVGQNLLHQAHLEFFEGGGYWTQTNEVPRSVFATLTWKR